MVQVTLTIDGQEVRAEAGTTLLSAARGIGIDIPTLCHHEALAPYGACRLCLVEISSKGRASRLVTSCVYTVEDGLQVETESERVVRARRMVIEFLLARAPGVQVLQEYARRYGVAGDKFAPERTECILCGLCVRYCAEVKKKNAIGFVSRGTERAVMFFPAIAAVECPQCGECYPLCPTGVLPSNYALSRVPHFNWADSPHL